MKTQPMTTGLRVTLSRTELDTLLTLLRHSAAHPSGDRPWLLSGRQTTLAPRSSTSLKRDWYRSAGNRLKRTRGVKTRDDRAPRGPRTSCVDRRLYGLGHVG
jgi:hypothetical protein